MPHYLLIAEKPDLMRQIETVYRANKGKIPFDLTFLSQRGHLLTLKQPDEADETLKEWSWDTLPFHMEDYGGWQYKVIQEKKVPPYLTPSERFEQIRGELRSGKYDAVVNAGDPDQEGELLIRIVLAHAGNKLPVLRFWTNDLTEKAVVDALQHLRDDEHDPMLVHLLDAAYGRQHSDYRFGMNLSRAATLKMETTVSCGRVETPILAIVCRRENEIRNFVPSTTYGVKACYTEGFEGRYFDAAGASGDENADEDAKSGIVYFKTKAEADDLIKGLPPQAAVVSREVKPVKTEPPKLFKLATAQIAAGKLGYNDADTLAVIQKLYEKKLLSYPRTDCEYLSSGEDFRGILDAVSRVPALSSHASAVTDADIARVRKSSRWVNDKALEDSGHSAIRPTSQAADFSSLTKEEQDIYAMICKQFLAVFMPPLLQEKTVLVADAGGRLFRTVGKTLVDPGYTVLFGTSFTDSCIPVKAEGDILDVRGYAVTEKTTTCPKRFTSPDIIDVCEHPQKYLEDDSLKRLGKRLSIGTPATRSAIIRKLLRYKYLAEKKERKSVYIVPTKLGEGIIRNLGDCDICKVDLTALWEEQLTDVRAGKLTLQELELAMREHVDQLVEDIRRRPMTGLGTKPRYHSIMKCPMCGKDILAGEKGAFCTGWKAGCPAWIPREKWGASFTDDDFKALFGGGSVEKDISADGGAVHARIAWSSVRGGLYNADDPIEEAGTCPECGGTVMLDRTRFYCAGSGTGKTCKIGGYRNVCGAYLDAGDVRALLSGSEITKTCSKDGRSWEQKLSYDRSGHRVAFVKAEAKDSGYVCPVCGSPLGEYAKLYKCGKKSCGFTLWKTVAQHELTADEIAALTSSGRTGMIEGFVSKAGNPFSASLVADKKEKSVKFKFPDRGERTR